MTPRCEGAWWSAHAGIGPSVAHLVVLRMDATVLLACERWGQLSGLRPQLPVDQLCLRCCVQAAKAVPRRLEWLALANVDYDCTRCSGVIRAEERFAWAEEPGRRHGALLCETCAGHAQNAAGTP